ncbi:hypothetical protein R3W88_019826 [Solanum pinnatisectum]|uniref:3-hydroxyisobutyryl-CoA hydrolase n=1 Tax=Solanum pinnatisectum TaxID=50273 RepID=A0AAV9KKP7_9SOLN|nr:hypothetical protein R3W88_019826 [Solanum pinnatisectum]
MAIISIPSSSTMFPMPQQVPRQNREALTLGQNFEKYEKDDNGDFVIIKLAFMSFNFRSAQVLALLPHSYLQETTFALVHGMSVGGGASLMVPMKFSVVTEKAFSSTPKTNIGFHPDCGFSYMLPRLPGRLGEKLRGKEVVAAGLATHFVPSQKLLQLEKRLLSLKSGDEDTIRSVINEFSTNITIDERSILNKLSVINECFSKDSVEEIIESFEGEANRKGNDWIMPVLKSLKKASPTTLKILLRSIQEGRTQTISKCLRRKFKISMNIQRTIISGDFYEGIRARVIDKDKSPKWNPSTLDKVHDDQLDVIFKPFEVHDLELSSHNFPICRKKLLFEMF